MMKIFGYSALVVFGVLMVVVGGYALYSAQGMMPSPVLTQQHAIWGTVTAVGIALILGSTYKLF